MMNLNGNDLLGNFLINNNANSIKNINNADDNPTLLNINCFKNMLNELSFENILDKNPENNTLSNDNPMLLNKDFEDILIVDVDKNDDFFNMISSMVTLLDNTKVDNTKLDIKDLLNIIDESNSSDELEEAMSKLLSELNITIISMDKPILKENSSSSNINMDVELISSNNTSTDLYSNENFAILDANQKNDNFDKLIDYLKNSNEPLTDKDITDILNKLNNIYSEDTSNNKLNSNKKKEVTLSLDNFNINIAHNKAINLNGVESLEETQGASSKILEKITTAIHEKISDTNLDDTTIKIRLKLYPKNLGELTIDILNHEGKMNIKIFSENSSIKDYISSSMKELISSLNDKKLAIDDIEVLLTGDTNSSFNNNNSNSSNNSNNSNSSHKLTKFTNYINSNDINDEILNNFESSETSERNLYVNI